MHWTNAVAMITMIWSGWGIYDDSVIFNFIYFPRKITLGAYANNCLLWHFAGMWLLMANGLAYLAYGFTTGRFRQRLLPLRPAEVVRTLRETLHFKLAHDDLATYNAVQKLLYILVILAGVMQVVTGLTLWKPVQLSSVVALLGGFQAVRLLHFGGMAFVVSFLAIHVALAVIVPRTLWFMLTGGPRIRDTEVRQ